MGKYPPLTKYLKRQSGNSVTLTCDQIQAIISPAELPPSARKYSDSLFQLRWWDNVAGAPESHARLGAGF